MIIIKKSEILHYFLLILLFLIGISIIVVSCNYFTNYNSEEKAFLKAVAEAKRSNISFERELTKRCAQLVRKSGVTVINEGYVEFNCNGKYTVKYYFQTDSGISWASTHHRDGLTGLNWNWNYRWAQNQLITEDFDVVFNTDTWKFENVY